MRIVLPMKKNWVTTFVVSIVTFVFSMMPASAELWPQRTVRVITPAAAGTDAPLRTFAEPLAKRWKQSS